MMITILTLHVPPHLSDDVIRYYETARILEVSGAVSGRLGVKSDDPGTLIVIATWRDASAYDAWQASPARAEFSEGILKAANANVTATSEVFQVAIDM